jgi:hypothetical protein
MKLFGVYFYNPFKKVGYDRIIGFHWSKDWHHEIECDVRFSILSVPHITVCCAYTTKTEFVEKFWGWHSLAYRNKRGGLTPFYKYINRQGIDEGRCSAG